MDWDAQRIISTYLQRWPIETFYQDSKTHLGLDEYRMRSAQALIQKLILHAHELLTQGVHAPDLFAQLFAKQGGALVT